MNANAQKLVDALRSGEHKQGREYLTQNTPEGDLDCCLGVACKIYQKEVGNLIIDRNDETVRYDDWASCLPDKVRNWLGFTTSTGDYGHTSLAALNDNGWSFEAIAEVIESEPKGLFE